MSALTKLVRLNAAERGLLVKAWLLMILVRIGLALFKFEKLRAMLNRLARPRPRLQRQALSARRIGWLVAVAGRYWYWNKPCLTLALILKLFLDRRGIASQFHLGIKKDAGNKLLAHAWITHEGAIILGNLPDLAEFKEFERLDGGGR